MSAASPTSDTSSLPADRPLVPLANRSNLGPQAFLRQGLQLFVALLLASASYFIISHFVFESVKVVGRSMVPTLHDSDHYLLNRWVYYFHSPQRSDVVVLRDPSDNGFSVKRIIAGPGDSVLLKNGSVYLNGHKLNEAYLARGTLTFPSSLHSEQLVRCGKDQYFLLGDNRPNSVDSRTYGLVPRKDILGLIIR